MDFPLIFLEKSKRWSDDEDDEDDEYDDGAGSSDDDDGDDADNAVHSVDDDDEFQVPSYEIKLLLTSSLSSSPSASSSS